MFWYSRSDIQTSLVAVISPHDLEYHESLVISGM